MHLLKFVALVIVLSGCQSRQLSIESVFDAEEIAYINQSGTGTLDGQAFLTRDDGARVYAAGSEVALIPAGRYAKERFAAIYGEKKFTNRNFEIKGGNPPGYLSMVQITKADDMGRFKFENLAAGEYLLTTGISWLEANERKGGSLMEQVIVNDDETTQVVMSGE